jgi:hypothetical protein
MADSLAALELERSKLLQQFLTLGDFRQGSITVSVRRCGDPVAWLVGSVAAGEC